MRKKRENRLRHLVWQRAENKILRDTKTKKYLAKEKACKTVPNTSLRPRVQAHTANGTGRPNISNLIETQPITHHQTIVTENERGGVEGGGRIIY